MTETRTATLAEFLLARIAEDEEAARATGSGEWRALRVSKSSYRVRSEPHGIVVGTALDPDERVGTPGSALILPARSSSEHIARWDPARVLAECEAKRRIVDWFSGSDPDDQPAMWLLALPWADHPDYRPEWRVG